MILVLGSTGTVGRRVVAGLVAAGQEVRAFTRDAARSRFDAAVQVVQGDLGAPDGIGTALEGADAVFVLTTGPDALAHELAVARAVRPSDVRRVVKLSSVAANPPVTDSYGAAHAAGECALAESDAEWTVLRAAGFMSNVLQWATSIRSEGKVYQPFGKIPRAVIDPADLAMVAIACLTTDGHQGQVYQVTGPEALTGPQQAAKVGAVLGRRLEFVDASAEQARDGMIGSGMPPEFASALLASLADPDPQRGGTPLPTVLEITGRPATTFDAWLARHRADLT